MYIKIVFLIGLLYLLQIIGGSEFSIGCVNDLSQNMFGKSIKSIHLFLEQDTLTPYRTD